MRKVSSRTITQAVAELCREANINLPGDVYQAISCALTQENNQRARKMLQALLDNADYAHQLQLALCQDTGLPYVFVELGQQVLVVGADLVKAINKGIEQGYKKGYLRSSIIAHPLRRKTMPQFSPGIIHIEMVKGRQINISVLPKGFGCENKGKAVMFKPTVDMDKIKEFIVDTIKQAGADACPPFIVGVGIGGGLDQAAILAKQALLRPLNSRNLDWLLANLEKELLKKINQLNIGPLGLGGKTTCLGVHILTSPTHIAGLPVAVNISCHALRRATKRL